MRAHWIDSPFCIANILGIPIDDWDILAPHSGLFESCNKIKKELWGRKLQLEIDFRDFDTTSSKGDQKRLLSSHLFICWELKLNAPWRCVFRRNKYSGILAGPGMISFYNQKVFYWKQGPLIEEYSFWSLCNKWHFPHSKSLRDVLFIIVLIELIAK
jgi:hypothetical protein